MRTDTTLSTTPAARRGVSWYGDARGSLLLAGAVFWAAVAVSAAPLEVKPFERDTVLQRGGVAVATVVVARDDAALLPAALRVAEAIGGEVAMVDHRQALDLAMDVRSELKQRSLVLIGNALDNAVTMHLYNLGWAKADMTYPGAGGWIVRTVVDPWGTGSNVVIVAGSDAAGTLEASRQFAQAVAAQGERRVLPWGWRFQSGGKPDGTPLYAPRVFSRKAWDDFHASLVYTDQPIAFFPGTLLSLAIKAGNEYLSTGHGDEITRFLAAVDAVRRLGEAIEPMRHLEFRVKDLVNAWEVMEADPRLSAEDRQATARFLFFVGSLFEGKYWNNNAPTQIESLCATTNHISNGNLGYLRLGLYLERRCRLDPADAARAATWVANADLLFNAQDTSYRSGCDANGYQWWTNEHMLRYALWRPDYDLFWNGNMRLLADILFATADNMGNAAKFGDTGSGLTGFSSYAHYLMTYSTRVYGDGRHHWISRFLNRRSGYLRLDEPPREPVDLYGVQRVPLSRAIYLHQAERKRLPEWRAVPWSSAFDKIAFRADARPESPYLLLDGLGGMGHGQDDCNAIVRVSARGQVWLMDAAYDLKTMYDHNGIFVARDGRADQPAALARLTDYADLPGLGATRTESPANGLSWARHILWDKDGFFVVVDRLTCRVAGDYQANAIWRLPIEGRLEGDRLEARQAGERFVVAAGGEGRAKVAWEGVQRALGQRAFALRQVVSRSMQRHDTITYANLLCWPGADGPSPSLERLGEAAWLVRGLGGPALVAVGGGVEGLIDTDAAMLRLDGESLALVGARRCRVAGREVWRSDEAVNVELWADGRAVVVAGEDCRVASPASGDLAAMTGAAESAGRVALRAGQTRLRGTAPAGLREAFDEALAGAVAVAGPGAGAGGASADAAAPARWRYDGVRAMVPVKVAAIRSDIACVTGRSSPVDKLIDGNARSSTVSAMWPDGQAPTVTFDLGRPIALSRIDVHSWDGLDGCALGAIAVELSAADTPEGFQAASAVIGEPLPGDRDIARVRQIGLSPARARFVRMRFAPALENGRVYLSEVTFQPDPNEEGVLTDINDVVVHDLDSDGRGEVLVAGSDHRLHCLDADGRRRWTFAAEDLMQDVWAGEIQGEIAIVAGSEDGHLYRLDTQGQERWRARTYDYTPRDYETGGIRCLTVATLEPGSDPVVIVGADNWHLSLFSTAGKELRRCYFYSHESTFLDVGDLDGDGTMEIFQGTSFAHVNWFDSKAEKSTFVWNGIGPAAAGVIADLDGDGRGEMIGVGQQGLAASDLETAVLWRVDTGSPQTCIVKVDLDGDGRQEVVSGGKNGFLWALGDKGREVWCRNAGDSVNGLLVMPLPGALRPLLLSAGDDGAVTVWDAAGRRLASLPLGRQVVRLAAGDLDGDGMPEVLAVTLDGILHALSLPAGL